MKSFNLSEWALSHRSFVWFLMVVAIVAGAMSYCKLGREEDPAFAIKTMVVQANWPGATIGDTLDQVTDRIEKELQQINAVDYTKSYTTPGQATVFVYDGHPGGASHFRRATQRFPRHPLQSQNPPPHPPQARSSRTMIIVEGLLRAFCAGVPKRSIGCAEFHRVLRRYGPLGWGA